MWQLVGLSLWLIDFVERLLKQCVFVGNEADASAHPDDMKVDSPNPDALSSSGGTHLIPLPVYAC